MQRGAIFGMALAGLFWISPGGVIADGFLEPYQETKPAPALSLEDIHGVRHELADFRGSLVLVNFWASWCPPCVHEMPSMQRLAEAFQGRRFRILAVNVAEGKGRAARFARYMTHGATILLDKDSAAFKAWRARVFPSSYIVDAEGRLRYRVEGPLEWDSPQIIAVIEGLIPRE